MRALPVRALPARAPPVRALRERALRVQALRERALPARVKVPTARVARERPPAPQRAPPRARECDAIALAPVNHRRRSSRCSPQCSKAHGCVQRRNGTASRCAIDTSSRKNTQQSRTRWPPTQRVAVARTIVLNKRHAQQPCASAHQRMATHRASNHSPACSAATYRAATKHRRNAAICVGDATRKLKASNARADAGHAKHPRSAEDRTRRRSPPAAHPPARASRCHWPATGTDRHRNLAAGVCSRWRPGTQFAVCSRRYAREWEARSSL